ncbi:hypothetical protein CSOJ01_14837 [Colletotrichum sojae]|uniref:Uncharacterized protein n=1 Tax=Colletotrichum sojae TaxID=2175907 RepID=A0A8H6INY0_9PEZI|nr:hypothetical protein CSOJ01_14837 [Colletotrichum sojae]
MRRRASEAHGFGVQCAADVGHDNSGTRCALSLPPSSFPSFLVVSGKGKAPVLAWPGLAWPSAWRMLKNAERGKPWATYAYCGTLGTPERSLAGAALAGSDCRYGARKHGSARVAAGAPLFPVVWLVVRGGHWPEMGCNAWPEWASPRGERLGSADSRHEYESVVTQ